MLFPALATVAALFVTVEAQFNNPPGVDIWCGKAYQSTYVHTLNPASNPGL